MTSQLNEQEIREGLDRLKPFHHRVDLPHGLTTYDEDEARRPIEFTRVSNLVEHAFPPLLEACGGSLEGKRVLDVACNCGGFSIEATKHGCDSVLGVDIVDHYVEQATFLKNALGLDNAEFQTLDVEDITEENIGLFDVTFCFGLLYHLENPVLSMRKIAEVTKEYMLIDTEVLKIPKGKQFTKRPLWAMNFPVTGTDEGQHRTTSRWRYAKDRPIQYAPSEKGVIQLMEALGFSKVEKIEPTDATVEKRYHRGRRASFLATR